MTNTPALNDDPRPIEPIEPDLNECCGNGCTPCVYDTYADEKRAWQQAIKDWEQRHPDQSGATPIP
ncbi:oxidoreductase-like domain-containing protein [Castellaniella sp.]|uniref:oxidoreductase-like domain-containing protein n=1 Tax=Castellaniella sp. TaxID=1955812 RepID=UPI002B003BBC|nr:oxidoreductase-like domain-containing protein [Castellaniella sp.]